MIFFREMQGWGCFLQGNGAGAVFFREMGCFLQGNGAGAVFFREMGGCLATTQQYLNPWSCHMSVGVTRYSTPR